MLTYRQNGGKEYIMQRTVTVTKIAYVKIVEGQLSKGVETIAEKSIEKAVKSFSKRNAGRAIVESVSQETHLYILDDEIFFKYARIADGEEVQED